MDMETRDTHIRRLIDRYFEGLTSLDEEKELSEYFRGGEVRDEFRRFVPLFSAAGKCGMNSAGLSLCSLSGMPVHTAMICLKGKPGYARRH